MAKLTKFTAALLALCTSLSLATLAACGGKNPPASTDSVPSCVEPATNACTDKKGHEYSETTGKCIRCGQKAPIPTLSANQKFTEVKIGGGKDPQGTEFDRIELAEDCYSLTLKKGQTLWLSFSIKEAGQYVLYSVDGADGITAQRHNASFATTGVGIPSIVEEGNFYSYVNCSEMYFNTQWRATYSLTANKATTVKLCFVRVGEPAWQASVVKKDIEPKQINGVKAQDQPKSMALVEVPYDSTCVYADPANGGDGYYHLDSVDGDIIYVAIDREASRQFSETGKKFTNVLQNAGTALNLNNGTTEDDDYLIYNYVPFIMDWVDNNAMWNTERPGDEDSEEDTPSEDPEKNNPNLVTNKPNKEPDGDRTKNCYENFCNSDGVYPVNQELFDFLNLFVASNTPSNITNGEKEASSSTWWLAACYTYREIKYGTSANPQILANGNNDLALPQMDSFFCKIAEEGNYILTCNDASVMVGVDDGDWQPLTKLLVKGPVSIKFRSEDGEAANVTVHVEKAATTQELDLEPDKEISVTVSAGSSAIILGVIEESNYTFAWGETTATVLINDTEYTVSPVNLEGEVFVVEVRNESVEEITFTLTVSKTA